MSFPFFNNTTDAITLSHNSSWVGTVRGRVGYAFGNVLPYVTGGLALANVENSMMESRVTVAGQNRTLGDFSARSGLTLGGGVDVALNHHWSLGVEYLRINLGSGTINAPASVAGGLSFPASSAQFNDREDMVRAKLNYKF